MRAKITLLISAITLLSSCSKNTVQPLIEEKVEIVNTNNYTKFNVGSNNDKIKIDKFSLLGYGYDAKEESIFILNQLKKQVINMNTLSEDKYSIISNSFSYFDVIRDNLTKEKALLKLNLTKSSPTNSTYANFDFLKNLPDNNIYISTTITTTKLFRISPYFLTTEDYTDDFNSAIENLTPKEIVEKYGTHVLRNFNTGYLYTIVRYKNEENKTDNVLTQKWENLIFAAGGDISKIITNEKKIDFQEFANSNTLENSQIVYFHQSDKNTPLYELVAKGEKREALKQYIEEYLK